MGLGPRWESAFIVPGPPVDASPELLRYIAQLHDQLSVSFKQAQDIINQVIIVGDGDGGPGVDGTTETDGGTVDMDTNISIELDFGGANSDWSDSRDRSTGAIDTLVGTNVSLKGVNLIPAVGDKVVRWSAFQIKDWASVNVWMASNGVSNNGVVIEFDLQYIVGIDKGDDWDVAYSNTVEITWTPPTGSTVIKKLGWVIVGNVANTWAAFQLTMKGRNPPQDEDILFLGVQYA